MNRSLVCASVLLALLAGKPPLHCNAQEVSALLTSRPGSAPKTVAPTKVGEEISTASGQRRRVMLANGVMVLLNQKARVKYSALDELSLSEGEAFVDVRGRRPDPARSSPLFTVKTPLGASSGRDASWVVRQDRVAVVRGTISVTTGDAKPQALTSGTMLVDGTRAAPLPRASHALDWTRELLLAAESPLVPGSEHAGGALVAIDPNGQEAKLQMRRYHIEDGFARTTIDQTYFNHEQTQLEGTFFFPPAAGRIAVAPRHVCRRRFEGRRHC